MAAAEKEMDDTQSETDEVSDTEDIYDDSQREEQMEEDEIDPQEAGFVEGYENPDDAEREIEQNLRKKKKLNRLP